MEPKRILHRRKLFMIQKSELVYILLKDGVHKIDGNIREALKNCI